jgi:hypothetical protein
MDDILISTDANGGTAVLTTASPQSHYGIPVLRIEADDIESDHDYGPADIIATVNGKEITGASVIAGWALQPGRTPEETHIARLYLSQWPDGPQLPKNRKHKCSRCDWGWESRSDEIPKVCPNPRRK